MTMAEYMKEHLQSFLGDNQPLLAGATEKEFDNFVEPKVYGGWKTFKSMWNGPEKDFTMAPLGKADAYFGEKKTNDKSRDAEMDA